MSKWNPGDVVKLKTGGWPMTVEQYQVDRIGNGVDADEERATKNVSCVWFEKRPTWLTSSLASAAVYTPDVAGHSFTWDGPKYGSFHEDALVSTEERTA